MVLVENKIVNCFKYSDIKQIYKEVNYLNQCHGANPDYLYIKLVDNREFKILIYITLLVNEEFKDISSYLLSKNKDIIVNETVLQIGDHKL